MNNISTIILAAGDGKRLNTSIKKPLLDVSGRTMLDISISNSIDIENTIVVISPSLVDYFIKQYPDINYVIQKTSLGTGDAVFQAIKEYQPSLNDRILIYNVDSPLLSKELINKFISNVEYNYNSILVSEYDDRIKSFGRVIFNHSKSSYKIIEVKEDKKEEIYGLNVGIYIFTKDTLIHKLNYLYHNIWCNRENNREMYLTDLISYIDPDKLMIYKEEFIDEFIGVNTLEDLAYIKEISRIRILKQLSNTGVMINNYNTVSIDSRSIVEPNVTLEGNIKISNSIIKSSTYIYESRIINSTLDSHVQVSSSTILDSSIGSYTSIGPYAYIRPKSYIDKSCKIGSFVEIKESTINAESKVPHLSYVGNTDIGNKVNVGAGTIIANYDGKVKHSTYIGNHVFIGSNVTIIAPLKIENNSFIAAGSTITDNIDSNEFAIARCKQINKSNYKINQ